MIKVKEDFSKISDSNLVFLLQEKDELLALEQLNLDNKIIFKLEQIIEK
jgi:hypothetical protein